MYKRQLLEEILRENKVYIERIIPYDKAGVIQLIRKPVSYTHLDVYKRQVIDGAKDAVDDAGNAVKKSVDGGNNN